MDQMNDSNVNNDNNDDQLIEDITRMAIAFRQANDEDTMRALNIQSSTKASELEIFHFFVIPYDWMSRAWPILQGKTDSFNKLNDKWREEIVGEIMNEPLLAKPNIVGKVNDVHINSNDIDQNAISNNSSDNELEMQEQQLQKNKLLSEIQKNAKTKQLNDNNNSTSAIAMIQKRVALNEQKIKLRSDLQLNKHFFLVGSNVWLLLNHKFGYDIEIKCSCYYNGEKSSIMINVIHDNDSSSTTTNNVKSYSIPPTGRFPYEEFLNFNVSKLNNNNNNNAINNCQQLPLQRNQQQQNHPASPTNGNNISDDDDDDTDGLYNNRKVTVSDNNITSDRNREDIYYEPQGYIGPLQQTSAGASVPPWTRNSNAVSSNTVSNNNDDSSDYWLQDNNNIINAGENDSNNQNTSMDGVVENGYDEDDDDRASSSISLTSGIVNANAAPRRRLYGSGLGNLGNTCFMNSTLQCLAHTEPLQNYFLSGSYKKDLNRENPLGTGGELAMQFAKLLAEMYVMEPIKSTYSPNSRLTRYAAYGTSSSDYTSISNVVYPRNFKTTLGKHAEQFMGYDQHDSQELATYLLDALHEDTNRVTKKPYIEKPEQAEDETDEEAAKKAWALHLKRENSCVLENFMGLVKSRLECCTVGCGRVSTTFDPFMYLSVPIPGTSERSLQVTYVPCDPSERPKSVTISLLKTATVEDMLKKVRAQIKEQFPSLSQSLPLLEDLCPTDVWQKEIHSWFTYKEEIEKIRETDLTFVYELRSTKEIRSQFEEKYKNSIVGSSDSNGDEDDATRLGISNVNRVKYYQLDIATLTQLNTGETWTERMSNHLIAPLGFANAFNPRRGSTEERVKIYRKLIMFIDLCHKEAEDEENTATGQKRTREDHANDDDSNSNKRRPILVSPDDEVIHEIEDRCSNQTFFNSVRTRYDLAVLEFLANRMRKEILNLEQRQKQLYPNGIMIEICMRRIGSYPGEKETNLVAPFVVRVASDMTIYELRKEIAKRLSRSFKNGSQQTIPPLSTSNTGQATSEIVATIVPVSAADENVVVSSSNIQDAIQEDSSFGSVGILAIRQIPLSYERKDTNQVSYRSYANTEQLGSISKSGTQSDGSKPISLASSTDEEEKALVSEYVGNHDRVYFDWPIDLIERYFDTAEFESVDDPPDTIMRTTVKNKTKTVLDCIEKFCQTEQLEETEQWYCNKCHKHVQAWKQFHIYNSPPHLIVHLKRFQYSATTHRRNKINVLIDFPLKGLDLTQHVSHWSEDDKDIPIYDCYAVTNHYGGLGGGHYTAYALNPDGVWCLYDDSRITSHVDPKEVVSPAAYVLYYRRRDVPVTEEFDFSLQTSEDGILHTISSAVVVEADPAIILNDPESRSQTSPSSNVSSGASNSSSNVAMIGDDDHDMDDVIHPVDETIRDDDDDDLTHIEDDEDDIDNEISSNPTSPMNSVAGNDNDGPSLFVVEHDYDDDSRHQDDHATKGKEKNSAGNQVQHPLQ